MPAKKKEVMEVIDNPQGGKECELEIYFKYR
jgi:hypothetical protein